MQAHMADCMPAIAYWSTTHQLWGRSAIEARHSTTGGCSTGPDADTAHDACQSQLLMPLFVSTP